jgi:hypothetical protein
MSEQEVVARIKALETKVARLQSFNQILLNHLLEAQSFSGPGLGPDSQNVHHWVINLSNEVWQNYRNTSTI